MGLESSVQPLQEHQPTALGATEVSLAMAICTFLNFTKLGQVFGKAAGEFRVETLATFK
jgi:hypothetical protein